MQQMQIIIKGWVRIVFKNYLDNPDDNGNGAYMNNVRNVPSANNNNRNNAYQAFQGQGVRLGGN